MSSRTIFAVDPIPITYPNTAFDFDQNGSIDSTDLIYFLQRWGIEGIETPTPTVTPIITIANTFTHTPTRTSTETPTPTKTETPTETLSPTPTETPTDSNSFIVDIGALPTPLPLRLVRIPAGSFMMGSPETERGRFASEGPIHEVTIGYDFFMGETEVTQAQWQKVMGSNPARDFGVGPDLPVYFVSWDECHLFLAKLNETGPGTYRLPTEAEWEYACRAGTSNRFYFGNSLGCPDGCEDCEADTIVIGGKEGVLEVEFIKPKTPPKIGLPTQYYRKDFMWYCLNSDFKTHSARQKIPNGFGLYDMLGNVDEWVLDGFNGDYVGAPNDGSAWETPGSDRRVLRGGHYQGTAGFLRSASRDSEEKNIRTNVSGFRVVWTPSPL
ncbi:MAG: formylglycine-generating enzyme family protein [Candidatus Omnitrophica bacterium]|nr:formylglycine-generating enzyme family protein [Candidatus Omnitrophota bacterium]